jgi:DNA-binding SARP family transcriptional activator
VRSAIDHPDVSQSVLGYSDGTYRLALSEADVVDFVEFEQAAARALGPSPPNPALLRHAVALWTGEPLPEERYEAWAAAWRERLIDRYAAVLSALATACEREGDHAGAVAAARQLVDLDPFDESAHRRLMTAYARAGRRGAALRQYLECRRALVDGLGVEPATSTSRLQARILAGEID